MQMGAFLWHGNIGCDRWMHLPQFFALYDIFKETVHWKNEWRKNRLLFLLPEIIMIFSVLPLSTPSDLSGL